MLEQFNLDQKISKELYDQRFPRLEIEVGEVQRQARLAKVPVILVFEGWDAAGKGTIINRLTAAMDPRGFKVHPINAPTGTERMYPWLRRFWAKLPSAGNFAIFDRSWYGRVLVGAMEEQVTDLERLQAYQDIREFERQLIDAGTVIQKFWLHISPSEQKQRFKRLAKNASTAWKVGEREWDQNAKYKFWERAVEEMLERTSTSYAPWTIIEATQGRHTRVKVFETVVNAVETELEKSAAKTERTLVPMLKPERNDEEPPNILRRLDLTLQLSRKEYDRQLRRLQKKLFQLEHELYVARKAVVIVYEGVDAAGKGGNIRRLTRGLDPRGYEVVPIAAPTKEELSHHYLWRFWKYVPKAGHITIFDRSWYGRVLVERVEGFCTEDEWQRAFEEINQFERQLNETGMLIIKFWLHIDQDEQMRRFESRQKTPHKRWKITEEDWRNREKWECYEVATVDMLEKTSTSYAPWTILEANSKLYARIKALKTVSGAIETIL